jgi:DNA polymerase-3 subunit delta
MMHIYFNQLRTQLKQSLSPCYLLTGDELPMIDQAIDIIAEFAQHQGFSDKQIIRIQQESDWSALYHATQHQDLFSQKKILLIRYLVNTFPTSAQDILAHQLMNKQFNQLWVITTGKLKQSVRQKKWYQSIAKHGTTICVYPLKGGQLHAHLHQKLQTSGISIHSPAVINQLITLTEGNLLAAYQAIEKLQLLFPHEILTTEKLMNSIHNSARFNIFQLTDEILKGNTHKALRILNYLAQIHHPPLLILWVLTRLIKAIMAANQQRVSQNKTLAAFITGASLSRQHLLDNAVSRLTQPHLQQLLLFCSKIDKMLKGTNSKDVWKALDILVLRFKHPNFLRHKLCVESSVQ